jgi:hypothetical protein
MEAGMDEFDAVDEFAPRFCLSEDGLRGKIVLVDLEDESYWFLTKYGARDEAKHLLDNLIIVDDEYQALVAQIDASKLVERDDELEELHLTQQQAEMPDECDEEEPLDALIEEVDNMLVLGTKTLSTNIDAALARELNEEGLYPNPNTLH